MFQNIAPKIFYNQYNPDKKPGLKDRIYCFSEKNVLVSEEALKNNQVLLPYASEWSDNTLFQYLFRIDDTDYYLAEKECDQPSVQYKYVPVQELYRYRREPASEVFAAFTAFQIYNWYQNNVYCGKCGCSMKHHKKLRALYCGSCGNMVFPKIVPAVMVAVTDNDRVLVTKYANATYDYLSLIAGFTEIGEAFEDTVAREVMEEVGLRVKNIRYYKSQPWGLADDIMVGYFCEVDGNPDEIRLDKTELKESLWLARNEIPDDLNDYTMAYEMLYAFRDGKEAGGR